MKIVVDKFSLTLVPSVFTVLIGLLGFFFSRSPESIVWPIDVVYLLFVLNVLSSIYILFRLRIRFWFVLIALLFFSCLSFFVTVLSILCITGDSI